VNCDTNLSVADTWGLGAVIRDEDGEVMVAATWKMHGFDDAWLRRCSYGRGDDDEEGFGVCATVLLHASGDGI
ncbi:hypothetical protein A2U01_0069792, partial [Trifolium medium]|nr:hypothetical protein [Trifolium medium]